VATNLSPVEKILNRIGKSVTYEYPGSEGKRRGVLRDRTVLSAGRNPTGVHYWHIVDLIDFSDHKEPWIRIGYYRKPKDRLVFAGQTTSTHRHIAVETPICQGSARQGMVQEVA
jgi:hypothetical protein